MFTIQRVRSYEVGEHFDLRDNVRTLLSHVGR